MRVLFGIGGSDDSVAALDEIIERARDVGDILTVAVVENPDSPRSVETVEGLVHDRLDSAGFDAEVVVLRGDPGSRLVAYAENREFDRLVLGGGERSPLGKVTIGHIAEFVIVNARISVTLIR